MKPALAHNIPFGEHLGARFFKVTVDFYSHQSSCFRIAAGTEGEAREAITHLSGYVRKHTTDIEKVRLEETPRFQAVMIRNVN